MNLYKLSILCLCIILLSGCKEDEPATPVCTQSTWLGTYVGTQDCDGTVEDITVTVTASGSEAIIIKHETTYLETTFDPLTPNGCSLDATSSDMGLTLTVSSSIDGDSFSLVDTFSDGTSTATCTITATRQ